MPQNDQTPAAEDRSVDAAFRAWEEARALLGHLRKQGPGAGQLAASPEVLAHFKAIRTQEALCEQLWTAVMQAAEGRPQNVGQCSTTHAGIREGAEVARRAFEIWATAENAAQAVERELLAAMHHEMAITDEFLQGVRSRRANAHSLFSAALREMKERAASLHHRNTHAPWPIGEHGDQRQPGDACDGSAGGTLSLQPGRLSPARGARRP